MVLCMIFAHDFWMGWFSVHGIGRDGFQSMVLDASACINMYCNIERNIMKNQAGSPGFGIQGKVSVHMCFMCYSTGENLCAYVFYVLCSRIVYFLCLRIRMQVISV